MNAVTQTEARAIETTAAPLEVAESTKKLILVPLSQLPPRRSRRNARKTPRLSIPEPGQLSIRIWFCRRCWLQCGGASQPLGFCFTPTRAAVHQ